MMYILIALVVLLIAATAFELLQIKVLWEQVQTKRATEKELADKVDDHTKWLKQMSDEVIDINKRWQDMSKEVREYGEVMRRLP